MTPMYCDYTGEQIGNRYSKFGKAPELFRDYYVMLDKVLSPEGKEEVEMIVRRTMEQQSVYKKETYEQVQRKVLEQYCNAQPKR